MGSRLVWRVGEGYAEESRASPRAGGRRPPGAPENNSGGGRVVGKSRVQRGFLPLRIGLSEEAQRSRAGYFPLQGNAGCTGGARVVAPLPRRRALPSARAAALPPRRRRAVDCGLGAAAASRRPPALFPGPSRAESGRRGEGKQWSREQKR